MTGQHPLPPPTLAGSERQLRALLDRAAQSRRTPPPPGTLRGIDHYDDVALAQAMTRSLELFHRCHGRWPALAAPLAYHDKLYLAKFFMPMLQPTPANKLRVASVIPPALAAHVQPLPIAWSATHASLPADDALTAGRWWLKANHGSGMNLKLDWPPTPASRADAIARATRWLLTPYGVKVGEWWYATIPPALLLVPDFTRPGERALDYKFAMMHGRLRYLLVAFDLPDGRRARSFYDPAAAEGGEWRQLAVRLQDAPNPPVPRPAALAQLCDAARRIGADFEQVRVDLLHAAGGPIHLTELTLCDMDARAIFAPASFATELGAGWDIASWYG